MLKTPIAERRTGWLGPVGKVIRGWNAARCWARYLSRGRHDGLSGLLDFTLGNHFFCAMQVRSELRALGELLTSAPPTCAMEIGTARGGTLFFLTRLATPDATIISVDLPAGRFGGGYSSARRRVYRRFSRGAQQLYLFREDSHSPETLAHVKGVLAGRALDYLFIDGDHRYEGVRQDFELYGPLVRKGGVIAFHDIVDGPHENVGGVPRFWKEVSARYAHGEIVADRKQGSCGIGWLSFE